MMAGQSNRQINTPPAGQRVLAALGRGASWDSQWLRPVGFRRPAKIRDAVIFEAVDAHDRNPFFPVSGVFPPYRQANVQHDAALPAPRQDNLIRLTPRPPRRMPTSRDAGAAASSRTADRPDKPAANTSSGRGGPSRASDPQFAPGSNRAKRTSTRATRRQCRAAPPPGLTTESPGRESMFR
jgi:hypothetical protein